MGRRFRDYDAAWAERDAQEAIPFGRIHGEDVTLPPRLPAKIALDAVRLQADFGAGEAVPDDAILSIVDQLFGPDRVKRWLHAGMDFDQLGELVSDALQAYTQRDDDEDGEEVGAGGPPDPGPSTSSTDGPSSKPTSAANTGST